MPSPATQRTLPAATARLPLAARRAPVACLAALLLAACGTFGGLSTEKREELAEFQRRAKLYLEGRKWDTALRMVDKGLAIDPQDYNLRAVQGACLFELRNQDPDNLRRAEVVLDAVYQERDPEDHRPYLLFDYAKVKQELGRLHQARAHVLERETTNQDLTDSERTVRRARADEHQRRALECWAAASVAFDALIDREELLRFAHKGLMEIAVERGDYAGAVAHAEACLTRNTTEQEAARAVIAETMTPGFEIEKRKELQDLIEQELRIRAALAEMYYGRGQYADAVTQLDLVLRADPGRSTDYYNRAKALEELGRIDDARRDYEKFLGTTNLPNDDDKVQRAFRFTQPG
ncbi:MAG: hypothetical protein IPM29_16800 [Planctomycetes bacterium]|nr:hypothetical protein [Planctomycetota bacterium]